MSRVKKEKDAAWAASMEKAFPPDGYQIRVNEMQALWAFGRNDLFRLIGAAYNYGFQRGRNAERSFRRKATVK